MRISVITPTRNLIAEGRRESFLEAVASVRAQTHTDMEHLVIDGASTDGTVAMLEGLAAEGAIAGFRSEPDSGVYSAMNRGAGLATGEMILFLNSDDFYHRPDGLAEVAATAARTGCDFLASPVVYLETPPRVFRVSPRFARILVRIPFGHPGMAIRRDVFARFRGFDEAFRISADYDLMLRLVVAGASAEVLDEAFVSYRMGGVSDDPERRMDDRVRMMKKNFDRIAALSEESWRKALATERLPASFLGTLIAARGISGHMRLVALYQLLRSLRPARRSAD